MLVSQGSFCNTEEWCINIVIFFCWCLKVWNIPFWSTPFLCFLLWDLCQNSNWNNQAIYSQKRSSKRQKERYFTTLLFPPSISILFPSNINGKVFGSGGFACGKLDEVNLELAEIHSLSTKMKSLWKCINLKLGLCSTNRLRYWTTCDGNQIVK